MLPKLNPTDYIFSFESKGVTLIFQHIVAQDYMYPGEWVMFYQNGILVDYISKKTIADLNKEGESRSPAQTKSIMDDLSVSMKEARKNAADYTNISELTLEDIKSAFGLLKLLCKQYTYFDFNFWDSVYEKVGADSSAQENVNLVQSYKNKIREEINPIFFDKKELLLIILDKLSKQFSVSRENLDWYLIEDVSNLFSGKRISEVELRERQKAYLFINTDTEKVNPTFYCGDEAFTIFEPFKVFVNIQSNILKGKTAHPGPKVKGTVKIISREYGDEALMQKKMMEMKEGEILVSETTEPALMEAMRKASAIITDIGGMLSHAAITARELNIPCIVGTGSASKVLKDGNLIEVDTEKGTVTILK